MMRKLREAGFTIEELLPERCQESVDRERQSSPHWIGPLARLAVGAGLSVTALCLGVSWGARAYVENTLLPRIETSLEGTLNREIELGQLSYFWPWHLRLGRSQIENLANIHSIDIRVDLGLLVWQRQVGVQVDLNSPHVLWMESIDRGWQDLDLHLSGTGGSPPPLQALDLRINGGTVTVAPLSGARYTLERLQAEAQLDVGALADPDTPHPDSFKAQIRGLWGGRPILASAQGDLSQRRGRLEVKGSQLALAALPDLVARLPVASLQGQTDLDLVLELAPQTPLQIQGEMAVQIPQMQIAGAPLPVEQIRGRIQVDNEVLSTSELQAQYGQISGVIQGALRWRGENGGYGLHATLDQATLEQVQQTLGQPLPISASGAVVGQIGLTGGLTRPQVTGTFRSTTPTQLDRFRLSDYTAQLRLEDRQLVVEELIAQTAGGQVQGSGQIQLRARPSGQFQIQGSGLDVNALAAEFGTAAPVALGALEAQAQIDIIEARPQIKASWQTTAAPLQTQGQLQLDPEGGIEIPQAQVRTAQGQADLRAQIQQGQLQAQVRTQDLDLSTFATVLPSRITADLSVQAPLQDLGLDTLRAEGQVSFPAGIAGLPGPIQGQAAWDGSGFQIRQASMGNVQAQGRIPFDPQSLALGAFDLNIQAADVPLDQVSDLVPWLPRVPAILSAQGQVDLDAQLTGTLDQLQLTGTGGLKHLRAGGLSFTQIQGPIAWSRSGETQVDLQGSGDRVSVVLGSQYRPLSFQLHQGEITASGERVEDQLQIQVKDLPLQLLSASFSPPNTAPPGLTGTLGGSFSFDLATRAAQGQAQIDALRMAEMETDQVVVAFNYQQGRLAIPAASLQAFDSRYELTGDIWFPTATDSDPQPSPQLNLQIDAPNGKLEDIISTFKWQQWHDIVDRGIRVPLGPADALTTDPIQTLSQSLSDQLQDFKTLTDERSQTEANQEEPLMPPPTSVSGDFQAQVTLSGSLAQPQIGFQLDGQNWSAQEFHVDTVTVSGSVVNGALQLQPLRLQSGERTGTFTGWIGRDRQEGDLQIEGLPLDLFQRFLPERVNLVGDLNADFALAGNLQDPQAQGNLALLHTSVNQIPIEEAQAQFTYGQGELAVDSRFLVDSEAIEIFGTVPYTLPFAQAEATSPQIDLNLQIPNKGLALVNLFTDQFAWESGESELKLSVSGTVTEPQLQGSLALSEGVARLKALADPITHITGEVTFDVDSLTVEQLSGQLGGGDLQAMGSLAINSRGSQSMGEDTTPLSLQIQGVEDLNLANSFYQGGISGSIDVVGLLLKPVLQGDLTLEQGQVDLAGGKSSPTLGSKLLQPTQASEALSPVDPEPTPTAAADPDSEQRWPLQFDGLTVSLGENLKIVRGQFLNFTARGAIDILGTLQDPRPAGTITITDGRFNLPIAPFRLDKSQPNKAVFDVDHGFDPFLDVNLFTRITELPLANSEQPLPFEERPESRIFGLQQQIEVSATVQGRASEITATDSDGRTGIVSLTSTPPRSEEEIFATLGGNALAALGSSAGVASLAGQEVLNQIQEFTGLDEIRLTPIQEVSSDSPSSASTSLGLELVKDVGNDLSVSGLINITNENQPGRYSFRYRLNSETLIRLTTDLEGNDIASVEFGTRF